MAQDISGDCILNTLRKLVSTEILKNIFEDGPAATTSIVIENHPAVSILLPIRNESIYIERGLRAILAQDYPADCMEFLIADGMSTDNTRAMIQSFAARHPQLQIHLLDNPGKIVPTGMNVALRQAKGEIIIRVDGHCLIARDYVSRCVEHIRRDGVEGVGGPMESIGESHMAKVIALGMSSPFGVGNSAFRTVSGRTMLADSVPFPAYTREIIERAGLYDEELVRNQDDEYNYRIRKLGGKILLAEDVRSTYFSRTSLKGLWRQYFQYGYWKVRVLQKHPLQMSLRQFIPPAFVLALFCSALLAFAAALRPLSLIVPATYLLANLSASVITSAKKGWRHLLLLPLIFTILHLSYGLGFLVGLLKFAHRWGDRRGKVPDWPREHTTP
jgi:glycosyltransferase involved in cell wall biosynthesis